MMIMRVCLCVRVREREREREREGERERERDVRWYLILNEWIITKVTYQTMTYRYIFLFYF